MEVIILAAGYATRLYPLTEDRAKPLLPVGPKPIIDHIIGHVAELADVTKIHVVSNNKFYQDFVAWAEARPERDRIAIYNDGTFDNADRLGAIGDAEYVIKHANITDDLWLVAGDNLFDFNLGDLEAFFNEKQTSVCVTRRFPDRELIKKYSTVKLDDSKRVLEFIEKPAEPDTDLIGICCYMYRGADLPLFSKYLKDGENPDAPGYFMQWLHKETPVHGFYFDGLWFDIGDLKSLTEADGIMRERFGLPERETYALA